MIISKKKLNVYLIVERGNFPLVVTDEVKNLRIVIDSFSIESDPVGLDPVGLECYITSQAFNSTSIALMYFKQSFFSTRIAP